MVFDLLEKSQKVLQLFLVSNQSANKYGLL